LLSYALLFFWYEPLCTSLRGFRRRLFMERLNLKNSPTPHIIKSPNCYQEAVSKTWILDAPC
jgi:hypothetical protein